MCTSKTDRRPFPISSIPSLFSLEFPGKRRVASQNIGYNGDELLVNQGKLQPGECIRGLVIFEHAARPKPRYAVFSSSSTIKWRL